MNDLVTLDEAKARLRITTDAEDLDVTALIAEAQAVVIRFITQRRDEDEQAAWVATMEAWDEDTVPRDIKGAILRQCGELYRFRGDDAESLPPREPGRLSDLVEAMLISYRDVTVA